MSLLAKYNTWTEIHTWSCGGDFISGLKSKKKFDLGNPKRLKINIFRNGSEDPVHGVKKKFARGMKIAKIK